MGADHCVESDPGELVVLEELPVHVVGCVLAGLLLRPIVSAVDQYVTSIGKTYQHPVSLSDVDKVDLKQRRLRERIALHISFEAARFRSPPGANIAQHANSIAPQ